MKSLLIFEMIACGMVILALRKAQPQKGKQRHPLSWFGIALVVLGVFLGKAWIEVPPASVAAMYDPLHGGIQPYDLREGWHLVPPWATIKYFSVRTQNYTMSSLKHETKTGEEDPMTCQTSEGLGLSIDATVLFHISPGDANRLWRSVGPNYVAVIVRPNVREATRIIISEYPIMSVYSNAPASTEGVASVDFFPGRRQEVADNIYKRVEEKLKDKGVTLERYLLRNVDYVNPEFEKAILEKQVAQQRIVTEKYEAEIQRVRAQANIVRAEGDAESIRLKAEALRVQPKVIQWELVQRLPEDIDVVLLPSKSMPLIDVGQKIAAPTAPAAPPPAPPPPQPVPGQGQR